MDSISDELAEQNDELTSTSAGGFVLTAGDVEIFRLIHDYRFLRIDHLAALTGRAGKRLHRRIFKLLANGYLTSVRLPQQKHIYALNTAAVRVLVEQTGAPAELLDERLRIHELKELFLRHEMMIVDLHAILALAGKDGDMRPVAWREGRELYDEVTVADHQGMRKLPIRPDAFFTIEDARRVAGKNRAHFFLEADRSTMAQARIREKFTAYWHYLEQGLHVQKLGIKNFRVLTVTLTEARAKSLCELAASFLPERARKYYLFTSVNKFSLLNPAGLFESVYLSPRGGDVLHPLVPGPTAPASVELDRSASTP